MSNQPIRLLIFNYLYLLHIYSNYNNQQKSVKIVFNLHALICIYIIQCEFNILFLKYAKF